MVSVAGQGVPAGEHDAFLELFEHVADVRLRQPRLPHDVLLWLFLMGENGQKVELFGCQLLQIHLDVLRFVHHQTTDLEKYATSPHSLHLTMQVGIPG